MLMCVSVHNTVILLRFVNRVRVSIALCALCAYLLLESWHKDSRGPEGTDYTRRTSRQVWCSYIVYITDFFFRPTSRGGVEVASKLTSAKSDDSAEPTDQGSDKFLYE